jgi:cell division protein ZapA
MAEVTLSVGGRAYKLACRDGEEDDLRAAAGLLESRVTSLMEAHGAVAEPRLLLMAALLVSGELLERKSSEARLSPYPSPNPVAPAAAAGIATPDISAPDRAAFEALAARAEALARQLEDVVAGT